MSSNFGEKIKISIFGESHGKAIGCVIDGLPPGEKIDLNKLQKFINRRAPGNSKYGTKRKEEDLVNFYSGILENTITGSPIMGLIENKNQHSKDYKNLEFIPRPSHADFTAYEKYSGFADMRGGGHFSGRLTGPICIAGGIAIQILERRNIYVGAHLSKIGNIEDDKFNRVNLTKESLKLAGTKEFPVNNEEISKKVQNYLDEIRMEEDSIGGVVEGAVIGLPIGLGNPMFDGVENNLAKIIFGIPGVKGLEFGSGFQGTTMKGSEHNDAFIYKNGKVVTTTNNNGGIIGGITNGMPLILNVAMKPTASISKIQNSINLKTKTNENLVIKGRHDPCIAVRAVPVIEAVLAIGILDLLLVEGLI